MASSSMKKRSDRIIAHHIGSLSFQRIGIDPEMDGTEREAIAQAAADVRHVFG
jgi:hypothetical protein